VPYSSRMTQIPDVLENRHVRLMPMTLDDAGGLMRAASDPSTFRYFIKPPNPWTDQGMREYCARLIEHPTTLPMTVRHAASGEIIGSTTFCDLKPEHLGAEIGWTWYAPSVRGSAVNPACKILLLEHAFEGGLFGKPAERVCLKTDARNVASRAAILKLGAVYEGILRRLVVMPDGHMRDSPHYSIMPEEWPAVRDGLEARLAAFV